MNRVLPDLRRWLPLAFISTGLTLFAYVAVQQSYRQSANDPQIQIADDTADQFALGQSPAGLVPQKTIDISQSLSPALTIYDEQTKVLASSMKIGDTPATAKPPTGTFDKARRLGEVRFTWQPQSDVRQAAILKYVAGDQSGFVLVSRSLREVEAREADLTDLAAFSLVILLIGTAIITRFA